MRSSLDSSLLICAWPKAATVPERLGGSDGTWSVLWLVIAWSFQSLWAGVHPAVDWLGRPCLSCPPWHGMSSY
jgi:hypothetical protein